MGERAGYVFKKSRAGVGYHLDFKRQQEAAKAQAAGANGQADGSKVEVLQQMLAKLQEEEVRAHECCAHEKLARRFCSLILQHCTFPQRRLPHCCARQALKKKEKKEKKKLKKERKKEKKRLKKERASKAKDKNRDADSSDSESSSS